MSSAKHTEGRLVAVEDSYGIYTVDALGEHVEVAEAFGAETDDAEDLANAARLVACWNACEGMEDPEHDIAELRMGLDVIAAIGTALSHFDPDADLKAVPPMFYDDWVGTIVHRERAKATKLREERDRFKALLEDLEDHEVDFGSFDELLPNFVHEHASEETEECNLIERVTYTVERMESAEKERDEALELLRKYADHRMGEADSDAGMCASLVTGGPCNCSVGALLAKHDAREVKP